MRLLLFLCVIASLIASTTPVKADEPGFFQRTWESAQFWKKAPQDRSESPAEAEEPGLVQRTWQTAQFWKQFHRNAAKNETKYRGVVLQMHLQPNPFKLSETRRINISVLLKNVSRHGITFEFPTTQRVDALLIDPSGKTVAKWSEDQVFEQETGVLQLNPGEQAQFDIFVPTREMDPGKSYTITALVLGQKMLAVSETVVPEK